MLKALYILTVTIHQLELNNVTGFCAFLNFNFYVVLTVFWYMRVGLKNVFILSVLPVTSFYDRTSLEVVPYSYGSIILRSANRSLDCVSVSMVIPILRRNLVQLEVGLLPLQIHRNLYIKVLVGDSRRTYLSMGGSVKTR